ncbi:MAG TPA: hypothetical protein PKE12_08080 [Kiritimatiellia bacterium]|nr:hypothetical protein [Kiritimatiellia bacterium]
MTQEQGWKSTGALVLAYVVLIAVIVVFARVTLGAWDAPNQMVHYLVRIFGGLAVARGLFLRRTWAYWTALVGGLLISFSGAMLLLMGLPAGFLQGRPYPIVDLVLILATTFVSGLAAVTLLSPAARAKLEG